jgi:hypothetical protein
VKNGTGFTHFSISFLKTVSSTTSVHGVMADKFTIESGGWNVLKNERKRSNPVIDVSFKVCAGDVMVNIVIIRKKVVFK